MSYLPGQVGGVVGVWGQQGHMALPGTLGEEREVLEREEREHGTEIIRRHLPSESEIKQSISNELMDHTEGVFLNDKIKNQSVISLNDPIFQSIQFSL